VGTDSKLIGVGLVIEVIVEKLEVKIAVLRQIEAELDADAIIATNTSSLSVTAIAGGLARPERVVGMHFFNPATILPLVEVVSGHATAPEVALTVFETAKAWGKVPVACRSTPGFIVNRVARPFYGEALRSLQEQAATAATLDAVMRESGGFKMGPCELMDLIGHDVNFAVTRSVYDGFFDDPRYKPSLIQKDLVDAGWLGRKSGRGFFDYREGVRLPRRKRRRRRPDTWTSSHRGRSRSAEALADLLEREGGQRRAWAWGGSSASTAMRSPSATGAPRLNGRPWLESQWCCSTWRSTSLPVPASLRCAGAGRRRAPAQGDRPLRPAREEGIRACRCAGLAVTRTVAMLVNEAADAVYQSIASADDVDEAMQKGVNYPIGPVAWGRRIGLGHVVTVLRYLAQATARIAIAPRSGCNVPSRPCPPWERIEADFVRSERQGRVGIVTIARPERRNALNLQVKQELVDHIGTFFRDPEVAAIVLTGRAATLSPVPTSARWPG
jgi:3-hydroxybutyryl-CoA dehydrogenase